MSLADATAWVANHEPRGELVLVLDGAPAPADASLHDIEAAVMRELAAGATARDAAATVASALAVPKRSAYDIAVRLRGA